MKTPVAKETGHKTIDKGSGLNVTVDVEVSYSLFPLLINAFYHTILQK